MKEYLVWVLVFVFFGGIIALEIWYVILNWDRKLGYGEYPVLFYVAVSAIVLIYVIAVIYKEIKRK